MTTEQRSVHTPGPWEMAGPVGKGVWIQADSNPNVAAVHGAYTAEGLANARLIARAPDLLALAKRYAGECPGCDGKGKDCPACADLRLIIAKVEKSEE